MFSNLLISVAAVAMLLLSQIIITGDIEINLDCILLFTATYFVYSYLRFSSLKHTDIAQAGILLKWISNHLSFVKASSVVALIIVTIISGYMLYVSSSSIWVFFLGALLSAAYLLPSTRESKSNLRSLPFLKTFIVALTWSVVTVLPVSLFDEPSSASLFISRLLFIWAITLPFDIRDIDFDRKEKLLTVVGQIGIVRTKLLSSIMLLTSAIVYFSIPGTGFGLLSAVSFIFPLLLILKIDHHSSEYYYTLGLDSSMIIQFLFIYIES